MTGDVFLKPLAILRGVIRRIGDSHLGLIAAGVAFFAMLAVFPALATLIALWGIFADPDLVVAELEAARDVLPPQAFDILSAQILALTRAEAAQFGWTTTLSFLIALWSARAGVAALVEGLDAVHGVVPRGGLMHQVVSLVLTLMLVAVALVLFAAGIVVPLVLALVPFGAVEAWLVAAVRWTVLPLVAFCGLAIVFRFGPNRRGRFVSPGLWLALALWVAASEGFSIYLANFGAYNAIYGSIGAVVALLTWLWLSAYAVLIGGALDAELEARGQ